MEYYKNIIIINYTMRRQDVHYNLLRPIVVKKLKLYWPKRGMSKILFHVAILIIIESNFN